MSSELSAYGGHTKNNGIDAEGVENKI